MALSVSTSLPETAETQAAARLIVQAVVEPE
jgi:hypothetical protein